MSKIVILGCGYIGTNLSNYISKNFDEEVYILGIKNDYNECLNSNIIFIEKFIEQICDDDKELFEDAIVIDAVGNTNATNDIKSSSTLFLRNCSDKVELIKKISEFNIKKYIFLSSGGTVYSDSNKAHKEDEALNPINIYALEKVIIESYLKINSLENKEFNYLILRLSNPYGGCVSKNKKQGIIDVAISKIIKDEALEFYGDIDNIRDYIHIDNVSEYIYKIAISNEKNEIFNIGLGIGKSIKEVFEIIEKIYGKHLNIINKVIDTQNIKANILDVSKINNIVKVNKLYHLEDEIKKRYLNGKK